jgi:hypothetical protein
VLEVVGVDVAVEMSVAVAVDVIVEVGVLVAVEVAVVVWHCSNSSGQADVICSISAQRPATFWLRHSPELPYLHACSGQPFI